MHFLRLLRTGHLARANGPDRFIRDDNALPALLADHLVHSLELFGDDISCDALLALFECLAAAEDHADAAIERGLGLAGDELVLLSEDRTALGVAQEGPGDVAIFELGDGYFTGEGTVGLVEDVLRGDFDVGGEVLAGEEEVEGRWGDDDFGVGVCNCQ